ncbi:right-handed parallel beta-helix repeat-containing protein [Butyrivibrio sp. XPD2002]|uniref:right-handed parallel beta-helix repeat-containing protein n=1 Tax=Butyrivibrio sp. XPD2002 TaxID=1280665 RepID=UPI0004157C59|nr:right-handed parallel beta-helix repeat-containing protein [Butyrivibrio sp. XPD2002]
MRDVKRLAKYGMAAAAMAFSIMLISPVQAKAAYLVKHNEKCVQEDEKNSNDQKAIQEALEKYKDIKLESGKEYYLQGPIDAVDGGSIDATGATIICRKVIIHNKTESKSIANFSIKGGTWKRSNKSEADGSSFRFHYGTNLKFTDMTIEHAKMENHAIELVACSNVLIENCKITGQGDYSKKSVEEQIQIDVATERTAPFLKDKNSGLLNGTGCKNITINNCEVTGCRAVCANYDKSTKKNANKYHKNIKVTNCTLTGESAEGLMIFNTKGITVKNNTIISNAPKSRKYYSPGLHIQVYGNGKGGFNKGKVKVTGNTIKGGMFGAFISANTSKTKFGKITFKNNKLYSKAGKNNAYHIDTYKKLTDKGNKSKKW